MVDDQHDAPATTPDAGRPKRTPPTIDLEATEVSSKPSDQPEASAGPADGASSTEAPREEPAWDNTETPAAAPPPKAATAVTAALVGALAACGVIGAAVWAGWPHSPPVVTPAPDTAQFDTLTKRLASLEARPAPSPGVPDAKLTARIDALEKLATALRADLDALRAQQQQTATAVNDIKTAPREAAAAPDLSLFTGRIDQLENATRALSADAAKQRAAPADDKALRRIVAVTLLDRLVRQGDSYAAALTAATPLVTQAGTLKPLEQFAASGVPSANTLSKELLTQIAAIAPVAAKPAEGTGILDRLQAGAERLVRIRRTDTPAGEGRNDIVNRAAAAARSDDIATARRELMTLSNTDRAPFQAWIALVDARDAALAASRQLATDAVAALGKPTP
ncbi:MAG: COG4223 family protein [Xanthobacteraceae bacterium]